MKKLVFDIETDNLLYDVSRIHCIVTIDLDTRETLYYHNNPYIIPRSGTIDEGLTSLSAADIIIGHNISGFDIPVLEKLKGYKPMESQFEIDTLCLSRLMYPERPKHSIESWAKTLRCKQQKVYNEYWDALTQNMMTRCISDVKINLHLFNFLWKVVGEHKVEGTHWLNSLFIEQKILKIHSKQTQVGVGFNLDQAKVSVIKFDGILKGLEEKILNEAPPVLGVPSLSKGYVAEMVAKHFNGIPFEPFKGVCKPFNKNATAVASVTKWFDGYYCQGPGCVEGYPQIDTVEGPFCKVEFPPINLNSSIQIKEFLLELGWEPTEWNTKKTPDGGYRKTSPKLTEDSYDSLPPGLGQWIAEYNIVKHRRGILQSLKYPETKGLIPNLRADGRVVADGIPNATPTGRMRHRGLVNLPAADSPYGTDVRECFISGFGRWLIGVDLDQVEARLLAHYCLPYTGGKKMRARILSGDFHQFNADAWGVERKIAKGGFYCIAYGGGAAKLANTIGKPKSMGSKCKRVFMEANPCVNELIKDLQVVCKRNGGWIYGLDGRRIYIRHHHAILNSLIQSAGSAIFKIWMILVNEKVCQIHSGVDQLLEMHDEILLECAGDKTHVEEIGLEVRSLALEAGKSLGLKVPITAEVKVGKNYSEVH